MVTLSNLKIYYEILTTCSKLRFKHKFLNVDNYYSWTIKKISPTSSQMKASEILSMLLLEE